MPYLKTTGKPRANVEETSDILLYGLRSKRPWVPILTIATSPRHVVAHAHGPQSDRDQRSSSETL